MSQIITCQHCGSRWTLPPQASGNIPCPNCQQPLTLRGGPTAVAPPPPPPPTPPQPTSPPPSPPPHNVGASGSPLSTLNLRGSFRSAAQRSFIESKSPLDLFDWRFEKYLTPWIVRITWVVTLVMTSLWLTFVMYSFIVSFLPEIGLPRNRLEPGFGVTLSDDPFLWRLIFRLFTLTTNLVVAVVSLLWIRVVLESAIVIFNIAKTLTSIELKTTAPESN